MTNNRLEITVAEQDEGSRDEAGVVNTFAADLDPDARSLGGSIDL